MYKHTERCPESLKSPLQKAHVAVAGAGGLGSNVAVLLTRAGIGTLSLFDYDTVEYSNLNRQHYFIQDLTHPKTDALKRHLLNINPELVVHTHQVKLDAENAPDLLGAFDIVVEAFDGAETKAMLISTLLSQCPNMTIVSGSGMAGTQGAETIKTQRVMQRLWVCGDMTTDYTPAVGLLSTRVQLCAAHQAHKVIELISGGTLR